MLFNYSSQIKMHINLERKKEKRRRTDLFSGEIENAESEQAEKVHFPSLLVLLLQRGSTNKL